MKTKLKVESLGEAPKPQTMNLIANFDFILDELTDNDQVVKFQGEYFYVMKYRKKEYYRIEELKIECLCEECQVADLDLDNELIHERIEGRILFTALTNSLNRIKELNTMVEKEIITDWKETEKHIECILGSYASRPEIFR